MRMFDRFRRLFSDTLATVAGSADVPVTPHMAAVSSQLAKWILWIPERATRVDPIPGGVRYLHPTKGWRFVFNRRLGLA